MELDGIYSYFVKNSPALSAEALGWTSESAQGERFRVISEIGIKTEDSVLDVGCGYGDFSSYVGESYLGIDIRQHAIEAASEKYKGRNFYKGNVFEITRNFDWVIASGIFCHNYDNWEEDTFNTLKKMYELSNKGIAVNFLSSRKSEKGSELKYVSPSYAMELVSKISNDFMLRHDYEMDDFTIYLYK